MSTVWDTISKPYLILAPMDDVTDVVFREIMAQIGPPDVYVTEFTNCDALMSEGRHAHMDRLQYTERQRPIIAQIWGGTPEHYYRVAKELVGKGFDGIDINMGCPDKKVVKSGLCSALIRDRVKAREIIEATKEGAGTLPVSVKTRIGFNHIETEDWIGFLLEQHLPLVTIHGRTVRELSRVPAHWDEIERAVRLRDSIAPSTYIVGNGDVTSYAQAMEYASMYRVDGVMIGRGVFHDPYIFRSDKEWSNELPYARLALALEHVRLFEKTWNTRKPFAIMKKFMKIYVSGFSGARDLRVSLMESTTMEELQDKLEGAVVQYEGL